MFAVLFSGYVILLRGDRIDISKKKYMEKITESEDGRKQLIVHSYSITEE